ncbi:MAG TPA: alpha/beta fold hydrolase [Pyrinomonadaceae bacterium]|nr:alpha/beta fold hydrolase [Pyrinomonadaceae bacterium]
MKKKFGVMPVALMLVSALFGQAEIEKYVGQYQVTGAPIMITVSVAGGKLSIEVTGQGKAEIELVSGEDFAVKGTTITLTFQKDASGKVTGMIVHQPGLDVAAPKINSSSEAPSDKSPHKSMFVTANGIKMNYLDWGGTGEIIILLAGLGNDAHVFDEIAPQLTDKFHVIGLTRRGFGETERPAAGYDTATRVEDVRAFMDAMKVTRANLVGHSLAGDEMTLFATLYPQRVIKMVYLDAAYDRTKNFSCTNDMPGGLPPSAMRVVGEAMNCPGWEKISAPGMPPAEMVNVQVQTIRSAAQFHPDYTKITAPSLAIYADADVPQAAGKLDEETQKKLDAWWKTKQAPINRASIEQFRKQMKNGQVVELKGATHYVFVGPYKDHVVKLMRDFLTKN